MATSMAIFGFDRADRDRISETPSLFPTAYSKPPPTETMSPRKRKASRKFDLPAAFGPTRKFLRWSVRPTFAKLRQFSSLTSVNRRNDARDLDLRLMFAFGAIRSCVPVHRDRVNGGQNAHRGSSVPIRAARSMAEQG